MQDAMQGTQYGPMAVPISTNSHCFGSPYDEVWFSRLSVSSGDLGKATTRNVMLNQPFQRIARTRPLKGNVTYFSPKLEGFSPAHVLFSECGKN